MVYFSLFDKFADKSIKFTKRNLKVWPSACQKLSDLIRLHVKGNTSESNLQLYPVLYE